MRGGFKVYQIDTTASPVAAFSRRDLYTVYLLTGPRQGQCADQEIEQSSTYLFFGNPLKPGVEKEVAACHTGYACRFTEAFFKANGPAVSSEQWSLLKGHALRAFSLRDEQATYLTSLFQKMLAEQQTTYCFKYELLRIYLQLVVHEAMRLHMPVSNRFRYYFQQPRAAGKLAAGWRSRQRRFK